MHEDQEGEAEDGDGEHPAREDERQREADEQEPGVAPEQRSLLFGLGIAAATRVAHGTPAAGTRLGIGRLGAVVLRAGRLGAVVLGGNGGQIIHFRHSTRKLARAS